MKTAIIGLILGSIFCVAAGALSDRLPRPLQRRLRADAAAAVVCATTLAMLCRVPFRGVGMAALAAVALAGAFIGRRVAADAAFIRLCVYYGDRAHGPDWPAMADLGGGVLAIDASMTDAALFVSSALAFDLHRPDEAMALVRAAARRGPKDDWRLAAFGGGLAAVGGGDAAAARRLIEPWVGRPDCPRMLLRLYAFSEKSGRRI